MKISNLENFDPRNIYQYILRGLTLQKILYKISKSFDFIEITLISSDFTMISLISSINNYLDNNISNCV